MENAVKIYSYKLGLGWPPFVSVTEAPCPNFDGEVAHIHVSERVICIWRKKLDELTLGEIERVAAHEVAHLVEFYYGMRHSDAQSELEIARWTSSVGGVVINGGGK